VAFIMSLIVQACIGMYWPSIGYLRGKIIPSELRNISLLLPKLLTLVLTLLILSAVPHSSLLMLSSCAVMNAMAAYLQIFYLDSRQVPTIEEETDEDEEL